MPALLLGALDAVSGGFEYEDVFRCLKTGLAGLSAEECDLLENYVIKWDIRGAMWTRDVPWTAHPEGYGVPWRTEHEEMLARVNAAREKVRAPLSHLYEGVRGTGDVEGKVTALYNYLTEIALPEELQRQTETLWQRGETQRAEELAQLWNVLCGVLDQFVEMLGGTELDAEEFARLMRLVLTQYSVGTIPVSLDRVSLAEMTRNDRHAVRVLFLMGANDHVLPAVGQSGGILNDDDREELAQRGIRLAPSGMEQMGIELQNLYAALVQPREGLVVSYPTADVSGAELRPAFVVDRLLTLFPELRIEHEGTDKAYRLTAKIPALETAGTAPGGILWRYFADDEVLAPPMAAMERAAALKRGSLSRSAVQSLYGERISMSASRVERLRSCHFAYFMEYGLKAKARRAAAFDAPQIGTFLHYLLEHVTKDVLDRGGFAAVGEEDLHALVRRYIEQYAAEVLQNLEGRNARFRYLFARLRNTAYAVVDQIAEEMRCSDFVPLAFELSFGDSGELPAVTISEPDAELRIGGKVDRVDGWVKDNRLYLRVVDYKSGKKAFDLAAVRMGLDIQMLLYLFALKKEGKQRFGMDIEPAGVLYLPARDEILSAERNITPEQLQSQREKELRRTGLLLSEPEVLQAMEHEALQSPRFLPVRVNREGDVSGALASADQLGRLGQYVERLLHQIAREVRDGNIDADPCCHNEDDSFCKYCDWADACHFQDGRDGDHLHYILPVKPEEFWRQVEEETERGGGQ